MDVIFLFWIYLAITSTIRILNEVCTVHTYVSCTYVGTVCMYVTFTCMYVCRPKYMYVYKHLYL